MILENQLPHQTVNVLFQLVIELHGDAVSTCSQETQRDIITRREDALILDRPRVVYRRVYFSVRRSKRGTQVRIDNVAGATQHPPAHMRHIDIITRREDARKREREREIVWET